MLGKSSPFKKFGHNRGGSADDQHSRILHRRTPSASSQGPPVSGHKRNVSRSSNTSVSSNFLAEQYERDRRAILSSCFNQAESGHSAGSKQPNAYVTHVRVIEDSRFPSSRPPKNSPLVNKKKRVLVVSSMADGSGMQIHKARENNNGSFQIGRTWSLKELACVEADLEQHEGFILTMGKRYYWETNTAKERTVFIRSLVKIYMENSGGHVPQLVNWDLSLFYLDETSYQRAKITPAQPRTNSQVASNGSSPYIPQMSHAPKAPVKLPAISSAQALTPPSRSPNTTPYTNVEIQSVTESQQNSQTPSVDFNLSSTSSHNASNQNHSVPQQHNESVHTSDRPPSPQMEVVGPTVSSDRYSKRESGSEVNGELKKDVQSRSANASNFLSELNSVLEKPLQAPEVTISRSVEPEVLAEHQVGVKDIDEEAKEDDFNELIEPDSPHQDEGLYQHAENEMSQELSFEKGDEVRYSQILENQDPALHEYHEVSTIREEPLNICSTDEKQQSPTGSQKAHIDVDNQALMDTLDEVNWSVDDCSSDLLFKLSNKLAETEHKMNQELLSLPGYDKDFQSYQGQVMHECEQLDPTLSFFVMELSTVSRDIEFVENQSNGLQVESANKKMLWKDLSDVLSSVSVDESTLNKLLTLPLTESNLGTLEELLKSLHTALKSFRGDEDEGGLDLGVMRALRERRQAYDKITGLFTKRVVEEFDRKFKNIGHNCVSNEQLTNGLTRLLMFSSLVLFCKGTSPETYSGIIERSVKEMGDLLQNRALPLLDTMSKEFEAGRKFLPFNYEQAAASSSLVRWGNALSSKQFLPENPPNIKALQVLLSSLTAMDDICMVYQNFIGAFFHIGDNIAFEEFTTAFSDPRSRISSLTELLPVESDRQSASFKTQLIARIIPNVFNEFFGGILKAAKINPPMIFVTYFYMAERTRRLKASNHEFLLSTYEKYMSKFGQEWHLYIEDQSQAIERSTFDVQVKHPSPYVVGFSSFIGDIEDIFSFLESHMIENSDSTSSASREILEESYSRLGESVLRLLGRNAESPAKNAIMSSTIASGSAADSAPMLINCNWLIETLPLFENRGLVGCFQGAKKLFDIEKERYSEGLLRSSMNHLYSFVDGAYALTEARQAQRVNPSQWTAYSRQNLNKILEKYNSSTMMALIDELHGFVEADFQNEKWSEFSNSLCDKLWSYMQGQTVSLYLKLYTLIDKHYKGTSVKFSKNDIISAFNKHRASG